MSQTGGEQRDRQRGLEGGRKGGWREREGVERDRRDREKDQQIKAAA